MKLKAIVLEGFRAYRDRTRIEVSNLTTIVGKNDHGKSTVLEALEIFFNEEQVKFDSSDLCVFLPEGQRIARIGCVFKDFDDEIVIDATARTTLASEYLLNTDGDLEIHKVFDCSGAKVKTSYVAMCNHPQEEHVRDLLSKKQADLRSIIRDNAINTEGIALTSNVQMRARIREHFGVGDLTEVLISLDGGDDTKKIWAQLETDLPLYALFKSDRSSNDADTEVQNPLSLAVREAIREQQARLEEIENEVRQMAEDVTNRTLAKLREVDPRLASQLRAEFKADRKWEKVFSFELSSDDNIPINKRGSGVRRLILFSFFRAEAERRRSEKAKENIIYAIEEPETSQNPLNQRLLSQAFIELSDDPMIQVILTTHTPGLAGAMPKESLVRVSQNDDRVTTIEQGTDDLLNRVTKELGVTADKRLELIFYVEGTTDIDYIKHFSKLLKNHEGTIPDVEADSRIAIVSLGGQNLQQWIQKKVLSEARAREFHLYDRGSLNPPRFQADCDAVNARGDGYVALLTTKNEIENYLHPDAVRDGLGLECGPITDEEDFVIRLARLLNANDPQATPWDQYDADQIKQKETSLKKRLVREVLPHMTLERLLAVDVNGEVLAWYTSVRDTLM